MSSWSRACSGAAERLGYDAGWTAAARLCRVALVIVVVGFALLGALTAPPFVVLVSAPAFGLITAGVTAVVNPLFPRAPSARRMVVLSATWATLLLPFLAGLGLLAPRSAASVVLLLTVLGAVVVGCRIAEGDARPDPDAATDLEGMRQLIRVLPTSMLAREWRSSAQHVRAGADPDRRAEAVRVRTLLLAEMARRDPAGVGRCLSEGDVDALEWLLGDDRGRAP
jgi:hypothetical protein